MQYNRGARSYSVSIPKVIVELKGWRGSFHPPPEVRAAEPDGTLFLIEDDPETGGIKLYPAPDPKRSANGEDPPAAADVLTPRA
ncbi:MAG TPA: hypothetical protein VM889_13395 [Candidatus Thermoplasmatota archaeon]|nr:hypothetical protein [Candidatus Thermoplasmatota archaeon]